MTFRTLLALVAMVVLLDQLVVRLADQSAREMSPIGSPASLPLQSSDAFSSRARKICQNSSIYLIYRYQFCLKPYTSGTKESDDGWHLVYHKPKPWLSVIIPARRPDSFYFQESVQGEYVLFVKRDGSVILGDRR